MRAPRLARAGIAIVTLLCWSVVGVVGLSPSATVTLASRTPSGSLHVRGNETIHLPVEIGPRVQVGDATQTFAQDVQTGLGQAAGDRWLVLGVSLYAGNAPQEGREAQTLGEIDDYAKAVGQYPATFSIWCNLGTYGETSDGMSTAFPPTALLDGLDARGITPVIFWQPVGAEIHLPDGASPAVANSPPAEAMRYSNRSIADGSFDAYLNAWGAAAKAYGKPVIVRYAQEMNGHWFPWSEWAADKPNGQEYYNVGNTAANYVSAWRHIHDVIRKSQAATNVKFLWAPSHVAPRAWYPGNAYVTYVGFDSYDRLEVDRSMTDLFAPAIAQLRSLTGGTKRIIIAETGVDERFSAEYRAAWLTDGLSAMLSDHPDVAAVIYFNFSQWLIWGGGEPIDSTWRDLVAQAGYQGRFPPATVVAAPPPDPELPIGVHDSSDWSVSTGWACDPDDYGQSIDVHFYADGTFETGTFLGAVTANGDRPDLLSAGVCGGTAGHGFVFATPESLRDGNPHSIVVYAINIGPAAGNPVLGSSPRTIESPAPAPDPEAIPAEP